MNDLIRMKKLAGILTEGVMSIPSIGNRRQPNEIDEMFDEPTLNEWDEDPGEQLAQHQEAIEANIDYYLQKLGVNLGAAIDAAEADNLATQVETMSQDEYGRGINAEEVINYLESRSLINNEMDEGMGMPGTQMVDEGAYTEIIQQKIQRAQELKDSMVDPEEVAEMIANELEQDGWIQSDIDKILNAIADELGGEEDDGDTTCPTCDGTGEGMYDGASCRACGGSGEIHGDSDPDDFDEPYDDADDDYMGPLEEAEETDDGKEEVEEAFDLNNGYDDLTFMKPGDFFPDGADSPVTRQVGPSGAKQGDNPEQKKMAVAEAHKDLVYNYRKFLKESVKK